MGNLIFEVKARAAAMIQSIHLQRVLAVLLAGFVLFSSGVALAGNAASLGERTRDRLEQIDRNTERPKTTGEFQNEVQGDVPLGERVQNTVRDSAEAFKQFGQEYAIGAEESARNVQGNAERAGQNLSNQVQR